MFRNITKARDQAKVAEPKVRLINPSVREPTTAGERTIIAMLNRADTMSISALIEQVAQQLYREQIAMGAGILDIGLLGPDVFARDVAVELNAGNGILWFIDN